MKRPSGFVMPVTQQAPRFSLQGGERLLLVPAEPFATYPVAVVPEGDRTRGFSLRAPEPFHVAAGYFEIGPTAAGGGQEPEDGSGGTRWMAYQLDPGEEIPLLPASSQDVLTLRGLPATDVGFTAMEETYRSRVYGWSPSDDPQTLCRADDADMVTLTYFSGGGFTAQIDELAVDMYAQSSTGVRVRTDTVPFPGLNLAGAEKRSSVTIGVGLSTAVRSEHSILAAAPLWLSLRVDGVGSSVADPLSPPRVVFTKFYRWR